MSLLTLREKILPYLLCGVLVGALFLPVPSVAYDSGYRIGGPSRLIKEEQSTERDQVFNVSRFILAAAPFFNTLFFVNRVSFTRKLKYFETTTTHNIVEILYNRPRKIPRVIRDKKTAVNGRDSSSSSRTERVRRNGKPQKRYSCIARNLLYPLRDFSRNVVILSSGCSGTLLSPRFVLTAAHCVHNGRTSFRNLQVAFQEAMLRKRIHYVKRITVPSGWLLVGNSMNTERYVNDYAVLELATVATGRREFMKLKAPNRNMMFFDMYFMGFSFRKKLKFGINTCPWESGRIFMDYKLITRVCGAGGGHSGSAVFTHNKQKGFRISGIVSHARIVKSNHPDHSHDQWTVITALTETKINHICSIVSSVDSGGVTGGACDLGNSHQKLSRSNLVYSR